MLVYMIFVVTALGGAFGASLWLVLASAAALAIIATIDHARWNGIPIGKRTANLRELTAGADLANALVFSTLAYGLGKFSAWVWLT